MQCCLSVRLKMRSSGNSKSKLTFQNQAQAPDRWFKTVVLGHLCSIQAAIIINVVNLHVSVQRNLKKKSQYLQSVRKYNDKYKVHSYILCEFRAPLTFTCGLSNTFYFLHVSVSTGRWRTIPAASRLLADASHSILNNVNLCLKQSFHSFIFLLTGLQSSTHHLPIKGATK